jgi:hypothetical protein
VKLFLKGETGRYSFLRPHVDATGKESPVGDAKNIAFEGGGFSVGMVKADDTLIPAAVIWHAGLVDPTWDDLEEIAGRVNRAWRVAYGDTTHVFFEGASLHADTIWLWFGS